MLILLIVTAAFLLSAVSVYGAAEDTPESSSAESANEAETEEGTQSGRSVTFDDLAGKRAAAIDGSIQYNYISENVKDPEFYYFDSPTDEAMAVSQGKADFYFETPPVFALVSEEYQDLMAVPGLSVPLGSIGFCYGKTERGEKLVAEMNEFLQGLKASGELEEIQDYWFCAGDKKNVVFPDTGDNGNITVSFTAHAAPYGYIQNGIPTGYEPDLLVRFCESYGYSLTYEITNTAGVLAAVQSGKSDIGASTFAITEERKESMYFSDSTLELEYCVVMRKTDVAAITGQEIDENSQTQKDFLTSVKDSFYKTFIKENRWIMILQGLGITLAITVISAIAGTVLGLGLYELLKIKNRLLAGILKAYMAVLSGMPQVVLLMIIYYIVFGSSGFPGFWVAVIAFSMNFSVAAASIFKSTIGAIDPGQSEAALALGYSSKQAFTKFILPQAAEGFIPLLKGQTVALLKGTAVVGYIAVQDLTKMGDIIRSRTYEAFFPLIATALIYLLFAWLISLLFELILRRCR